MSSSPSSALVIAHPGHELRIHHWIETSRPTVFVLTDGSGATGHSRLEATRRLLQAAGAHAGSVFGPFTDRAVYDALLRGDVRAMAVVTLNLARALAEEPFELVVADAWEGYNPSHDLCRVVADLAVETAAKITGRPPRSFSYTVVAPASSSVSADDVVVPVGDAAYERKLAAAYAYVELRDDAESMIARYGHESLRAEVLQSWNHGPHVPVLSEAPWYEQRGEQRVADHRYASVIRYEEHVAPFLRALIEAVRSSEAVFPPAADRHAMSPAS